VRIWCSAHASSRYTSQAATTTATRTAGRVGACTLLASDILAARAVAERRSRRRWRRCRRCERWWPTSSTSSTSPTSPTSPTTPSASCGLVGLDRSAHDDTACGRAPSRAYVPTAGRSDAARSSCLAPAYIPRPAYMNHAERGRWSYAYHRYVAR